MPLPDPQVTSVASFLLLTPLPDWSGNSQEIAAGLEIRRLNGLERAAVERSQALLEHHDIDDVAVRGCWLCYQFENPHPADNVRHRRRQEAAIKLMLHGMYAIQILVPIGAPNLFLLYRHTSDGLALESAQHRPPYIGTAWARLAAAPASFAEDIPLVLERLHTVFQQPILRLQIPVWLLEQGLVAPDRHIRILLWATGLDGITRSGGVCAFSERLCGLLGGHTAVFASDREGRQPHYRVAEVAEDLYLLRNEMAHGLPFHEKFRKTKGFLDCNGQPIAEQFADWRYDHVLEECAGILLCRALREVFVRNVAFDVHTGCWAEQCGLEPQMTKKAGLSSEEGAG